MSEYSAAYRCEQRRLHGACDALRGSQASAGDCCSVAQCFTHLQRSVSVQKVKDIEKLNALVTKASTKTCHDLVRAPWNFVLELTMKLILVTHLPSHLFQCFGILIMEVFVGLITEWQTC